MDIVAQTIVSGILVGAVYGLAALGLSLAFGVLRVLNVAHGELIMVGGYATFFMFSLLGIDPFVSAVVVFALLMLMGLVLPRLLFAHIVRSNEASRIKNSLLIGFGLTLILHTAAVRLFSADNRTIFTAYSTLAWTVGSIRLPVVKLAGLAIAILAAVMLDLFQTRTTWGKALRATSEDWTIAALTGINVQRAYLVSFALAAGLAGLTGVLISVGFSINPSIGLQWTLKALIVVVLAGLGSVRGTLLAGILLGVAEAISSLHLGGEYREIVGLVIFLVFLSFRPQGLFGVAHA